MLQDFRYGLRLLGKSPSFTAVAMLSLMLGIGANSAIFTVVHAVLLKPLPYKDPQELVAVREHAPGDPSTLERVSPANFADWAERAQSFTMMAAYADSYAAAHNLTGVDEPERVRVIGAAAGFFALLGIQPLIGRELQAGEVRTGRTVLLSHAFWQRKFGGDPNVLGRQVTLSEEPHTIIGVLPADFRFKRHVELWRQFVPQPASAMPSRERSNRYWSVVARLRPGITLQQAQADMNSVADRLAREYPSENGGRGVRVVSLHEDLTGAAAPPLGILYGAVCVVLLIACANVAGLLLARLTARQREIGVRVALGASRAQLARQLLAESLVLALPAAGVGLLLASWMVKVIVALSPPDLPRLERIAMNGSVVIFTMAISIASAIAFGLAPILQARRVQPATSLRYGRGITPAEKTIHAALIVGEMALALILLVGAGLLVRTYASLTAVNPGFRPDGIVTMDVGAQGPSYFIDWNRVVAFHDGALSAVSSVPGVRAAAVTSLVPFGEGRFNERVARADAPADERPAEYRFVSPGYFSTLGVPMHSGRDFQSGDRVGAPLVAILGASAAERLFGREDPIGKQVLLRGKTTRVVVGVVGDTHLYGFGTEPPLQVYAPYPQANDVFWTGLTFVMRTEGDALGVAALARQRVLAVDRRLPPFNVRTIESLMAASLAPARMYAALLAAFAAFAVLLACVGLYGLIAYLVAHRTREFGIRLALGATAIDMKRLMLREAARLVAVAIAVGAAAAAAGSHILAQLLFGVTPTDWPTFLGVSLLLVTVAFAAAYAPARRAMRVDPVSTLRAE